MKPILDKREETSETKEPALGKEWKHHIIREENVHLKIQGVKKEKKSRRKQRDIQREVDWL